MIFMIPIPPTNSEISADGFSGRFMDDKSIAEYNLSDVRIVCGVNDAAIAIRRPNNPIRLVRVTKYRDRLAGVTV